jgi:hypothetical protein
MDSYLSGIAGAHNFKNDWRQYLQKLRYYQFHNSCLYDHFDKVFHRKLHDTVFSCFGLLAKKIRSVSKKRSLLRTRICEEEENC